MRREELRRQRWKIKGRELELVASKNFLLPSLDLVGRYRWRGFGHDLLDPAGDGPRFDNAYKDLTTGDFQEWQLGAEFSVPLGFRQGHAAVRNAELQLARERCVLGRAGTAGGQRPEHRGGGTEPGLHRAANRDQPRRGRRSSNCRPSWPPTTRTRKRRSSTYVLDAQRRYADAESRYYQTRVEYALAIRNVHFERRALLDYCCVALSEGSWPGDAYLDAAQRERLRGRPHDIDYRLNPPPLASTGLAPPRLPPPAETVPTPAPAPLPGAESSLEDPPPAPLTRFPTRRRGSRRSSRPPSLPPATGCPARRDASSRRNTRAAAGPSPPTVFPGPDGLRRLPEILD